MKNWLPIVLLLTSVASLAADPPPGYARIEHGGVIYHTLTVDPSQVQLRWRGPDEKPFRRMDLLKSALEAEGAPPLAIMNGGIYEMDGIPSGLYIENGAKLRPLNVESKPGNFFWKPNGVFAITESGQAVIQESVSFTAAKHAVRHAVQSGPMLLIDGKTHPEFRPGNTSFLHRNGVGVIHATGEVLFAMTEFNQTKFPNMHAFADFFRTWGCRDALFLDGDISEMYVRGVPELERVSRNELASYIVISPAQDE